jgi:hypothetical protein
MARAPVQLGSAEALPVFSDLHMRPETLATTIGVVRAMRAEAQAMGVREVGFTGDWYHVRGLMPVTLENEVADELGEWARAGLRLLFIPGNHDQVNVGGRHAFEVFRTHPAVALYDRPTVDRWGLWVPYIHDLDEVRKVLDEHRGRVPRLFWHGAILGAAMNDHVLAERGLAPGELDGFPLVVLGHFHKRQCFGQIYYVGSPWETRSDESRQAKGFAVVRGLQLTYETREWGPRFHRVEGTNAFDVIAALGAARPEDTVRVVVPEAEVEAVSKALAGRYADYTVTPQRVEVASVRALPGQAFTLRQHAERLVAERHGDLDSVALMRAFTEFTS